MNRLKHLFLEQKQQNPAPRSLRDQTRSRNSTCSVANPPIRFTYTPPHAWFGNAAQRLVRSDVPNNVALNHSAKYGTKISWSRSASLDNRCRGKRSKRGLPTSGSRDHVGRMEGVRLYIASRCASTKNFRRLGRSTGRGGGRKKGYAAVNDIDISRVE